MRVAGRVNIRLLYLRHTIETHLVINPTKYHEEISVTTQRSEQSRTFSAPVVIVYRTSTSINESVLGDLIRGRLAAWT